MTGGMRQAAEAGSGEKVRKIEVCCSCCLMVPGNPIEATLGLFSEVMEAVEARLKAGRVGIRKLDAKDRLEWVLGLRLKFEERPSCVLFCSEGLSQSKSARETEEFMLGLRLKVEEGLLLKLCLMAAEAHSSNASATLSRRSFVEQVLALVST